MKKPPQIDLSKVKIGQRVKLRNGEVTTLTQKRDDSIFPWRSEKGDAYRKDGCYFADGSRFKRDIIQILPLPKKKAVKKPVLKNYLQIKNKNQK